MHGHSGRYALGHWRQSRFVWHQNQPSGLEHRRSQLECHGREQSPMDPKGVAQVRGPQKRDLALRRGRQQRHHLQSNVEDEHLRRMELSRLERRNASHISWYSLHQTRIQILDNGRVRCHLHISKLGARKWGSNYVETNRQCRVECTLMARRRGIPQQNIYNGREWRCIQLVEWRVVIRWRK